MRIQIPVMLILALGLAGAGVPAAAQDGPAPDRRPAPLFREDTPLAITLTADFKRIFKDRDTLSTERYPAALAYRTATGDTGSMAVELSTRGHSRLLPSICDFPPLRIHLGGDERPPLLKGPPSLKLGVNCRPRDKAYEQFVLEEYMLYQINHVITDWSFLTRLARATYIQADKGDTIATTWSFFIEHDDDVARRNGGVLFEESGVRWRDVDSAAVLTASLFEYMIGNTDWALPLLHNVRVVRVEPGFYYPVVYDFDFSGIMKTPYAKPSPRLPIRSVRERLWRGPCADMAVMNPIIARFDTLKDTVYTMYRGFPGLDPKRVESALKYLDDFYKVINDPKKARTEFTYAC
ncbi:MAG: hypothetical protein H6R40_78 [Gemmatimonadetes bacterium]|nr:hypothetical protein [Gemmatimonadota bacterium]